MNERRERCKQYLHHVIQPTLAMAAELSAIPNLASVGAEALLLGTALIESECGAAIVQYRGGPGLGVWQMEPPTARDHLDWIERHPAFKQVTSALLVPGWGAVDQLPINLALSCWLARVHYWRRDPAPVPRANNFEEQARRWGRYYQTQSIPEKMAAYVTKMEDCWLGIMIV